MYYLVKLPLALIVIFVISRCILGTEVNTNRLLKFSNSSSCKEMLDSFAYFTSNFTYCAIRHARPISLCRECVTSYMEVREIYTAILEIEDTGGGLCRDQLTNLDRLQVVGSGFDYVDQLWSRAFCNSCFAFDHGKPHLTDNVLHLLNASAVLDACVDTYHNTTDVPDTVTCNGCLEKYSTLNNLYKNMKADSGDINFCMDIIDMMNTTRYRWSRILGCGNDRKKTEKTFMAIMTGILVSFSLFYAMVYVFTTKAEEPIIPQKRWKEKFTKRLSISTPISS